MCKCIFPAITDTICSHTKFVYGSATLYVFTNLSNINIMTRHENIFTVRRIFWWAPISSSYISALTLLLLKTTIDRATVIPRRAHDGHSSWDCGHCRWDCWHSSWDCGHAIAASSAVNFLLDIKLQLCYNAAAIIKKIAKCPKHNETWS